MVQYSGTVCIPREWAAVVLELKNRPRPRSPNFTTADAVTNTLAGLMSVWRERERERERSITTTIRSDYAVDYLCA